MICKSKGRKQLANIAGNSRQVRGKLIPEYDLIQRISDAAHLS
jgi:hypothetical protein